MGYYVMSIVDTAYTPDLVETGKAFRLNHVTID